MTYVSTWLAYWISLYVLSAVLASLRIWSRVRAHHFRLSDGVATFSLALSTCMFGIGLHAGRAFLTRPGTIYQVTLNVAALFCFLVYTLIGVLVAASKCCITLLLLEVETHKGWRIVLKGLTITIVLAATVNFVFTFFSCFQIYPTLYWNITAGFVITTGGSHKKYVDLFSVIPYSGSINMVFEAIIFICAISLVLRLKCSALQKAGLIAIFSLGLLTIIASIMSIISVMTNKSHYDYSDMTKVVSQFESIGVWYALEAYTGLVVSSLLPLKAGATALYVKVYNKFGRHKKMVLPRPGLDSIFVTTVSEQRLSYTRPSDHKAMELFSIAPFPSPGEMETTYEAVIS